ncbi:hypothetical protein BHE90_005978 [Fusarium euwallaceae]|uniref:Major facilitator superfamily (MFS) profile domain-containing protein n=1 Tax=Fusarium euwallaceae TaxID=1147111 RepID=A0A430LUW8_9HYPO|nr:hypothetical protein BHE90_005978 [Fusarium euwallaceae]
MTREERAPLLPETRARTAWYACGAEVPILVAGFIITLSFSLTQVPILYAFHLMECEIFYQTHPPYTGLGDKFSRDEIAALTATQFSILGMTTTLDIEPICCRMASQRDLGLELPSSSKRSSQVFCTQLIAIIGGPAGYVLIVNIVVSEIVEPVRRTSVFGKLQGCIMLGQGVGYLAGSMIRDVFGIQSPFEVAFVCFLLATIYARVALPYLAPEATFDNHTVNRGASGLFRPLKILLPQKVRLRSGQIVKHYGVLFLCFGVFLGVLATDYAPFMIQMYATAEFNFDQAENGWLMSGWAVMRSIFLLLLFPYIITRGRTWVASRGLYGVANTNEQPSETTPYYEDFDTLTDSQARSESTSTQSSDPDSSHLGFDLFFLRWSLVIDGVLTTIAAFATHRWHIYLGSGAAPFAAKGVITDMCSSSQRADALDAITLVENIARLATQGFFGILFAFFAGAGKAYLTFFCNGAIALLGMGVLLWCQFTPRGSRVMGEEDVGDGTSAK